MNSKSTFRRAEQIFDLHRIPLARRFQRFGTLTILGAGILSCHAQNLVLVATNHSPSPDGLGYFSDFSIAGPVPLNDSGDVVFPANLTGSGVNITNSSGIFRGNSSSGSNVKVVR